MSEKKAKIPDPDQKKRLARYRDFFHYSSKCAGCPYGYMQYCVGICWKETYKGYIGKRKDRKA